MAEISSRTGTTEHGFEDYSLQIFFAKKKNISRVEKQLRSMTRQRQWMLRTLQLCEPCSLPTVDSPAATPTLCRSRSCFMQLYCHERTLGLKDTPLPGLVGSFLVPPVHGALARAASCSLSARICRKWETGRVGAVLVTRQLLSYDMMRASVESVHVLVIRSVHEAFAVLIRR